MRDPLEMLLIAAPMIIFAVGTLIAAIWVTRRHKHRDGHRHDHH